LYLYDTDVEGDITYWVLPSSLHELNVSWSGVSGDLTDWVLPEELTHLTVNNTELAGDLSNWEMPSALQYLHLAEAGFTGDISGWIFPASMVYFYASVTEFTGVPDCSNAVNLAQYQRAVCGLDQDTVDAILWNLYQAASKPRTASGGTIELRWNAAPSGTYQAAGSCPVTVETPGAEIAHELANDGCSVGFNPWEAVNVITL